MTALRQDTSSNVQTLANNSAAIPQDAPPVLPAPAESGPQPTARGASIGEQLEAKGKEKQNVPALPFHPGRGVPRPRPL